MIDGINVNGTITYILKQTVKSQKEAKKRRKNDKNTNINRRPMNDQTYKREGKEPSLMDPILQSLLQRCLSFLGTISSVN